MSTLLITGPESLTPGHFYHHAGHRGIIYFCSCTYWLDPANDGAKAPQPGSEQMIALNGDLPGAVVYPPDEAGTEAFWNAFYPAPGLMIVPVIFGMMTEASASLMELARILGHFPEDDERVKALMEHSLRAHGLMARATVTLRQMGHEQYAEQVPREIAAKNHTLARYEDFIQVLFAGLGTIDQIAATIVDDAGSARIKNLGAQIESVATNLATASPFHP